MYFRGEIGILPTTQSINGADYYQNPEYHYGDWPDIYSLRDYLSLLEEPYAAGEQYYNPYCQTYKSATTRNAEALFLHLFSFVLFHFAHNIKRRPALCTNLCIVRIFCSAFCTINHFNR